ncbi:hypothetical protein BsWGS_29212 [Bradybaena similaris]
MSRALFLLVFGLVDVFIVTARAEDDQGFTYGYVTADWTVVELECKARVYFDDHQVLSISIYNISTMTRMAEVVAGRCPTIEDTSNAGHLYLPGCADVAEPGRSSLKVLITKFDASIAQTFLCNATKLNEEKYTTYAVWVVTVDRPDDSIKNTDTDYSGHTWLPDPAYKMLAGLEREVSILEPAMIGTVVILAIILFSLAAQLFLSCKIIRYMETTRPPKRYPLSGSQSKMSETQKSGPLEGQPFYASV